MTLVIGTILLVGVLVGGLYLYVQASRLEDEIRTQARGNGRSRPRQAVADDGEDPD